MLLTEMQKHVYLTRKGEERGEWNKGNIQIMKLWNVSPLDKIILVIFV